MIINGILSKYIDKDSRSLTNNLHKKGHILFCFFTNWTLLLVALVIYLTKKKYKVPSFLWRAAFSLLVSVSLTGTYMVYFHTKKFMDRYNISKPVIIISDFITHILPLILLCYYKDWIILHTPPKTPYLLSKMIAFMKALGSIYFILFGTHLYVMDARKLIGGSSILSLIAAIYFSRI